MPDHCSIARFRSGKARDAIEGLFYQYVRKLAKEEEIQYEEVFIDGTKIEKHGQPVYLCVAKECGKAAGQGKGEGKRAVPAIRRERKPDRRQAAASCPKPCAGRRGNGPGYRETETVLAAAV